MKTVSLPPPRVFEDHIRRFYWSLRQYESVYAPALNKYYGPEWPEYNAYVCPLCAQNHSFYTADSRILTTTSFNLDHYPPESVGGKNVVIVCEPCNNIAGTKFEPELKTFLKQQSWNYKKTGSEIHGKVTLKYKGAKKSPGNYSVKVKLDNDGIPSLNFGSLRRIPHAADWVKHAEQNLGTWELSLQINNPDSNKVARSVLKAAYLYCFNLWGYEFVFSDNAAKMRKCIAGEIDYPIKAGHSYLIPEEVVKIPPGVAFIDKPDSHKNYVVNVPLHLKDSDFKCVAGVIIPKPTESGWEELAAFKWVDEVNLKGLVPYDINANPKGYSGTWESIMDGGF